MNPNSQHQIWSKWQFGVVPGRKLRRSIEEIKVNCQRFGRKAFGSAAAMRITIPTIDGVRCLLVEVLAEGHPVHDPKYVEWMGDQWRTFFTKGFGNGTVMRLETKIEAGSRQDGTPSDQLIILPSIAIEGASSHE